MEYGSRVRFALVALALIAVACSSAESQGEPTRDLPEYSEERVAQVIASEARTLIDTCIDGAYQCQVTYRNRCTESRAEYHGSGVWECDLWWFDEDTGKVWKRAR